MPTYCTHCGTALASGSLFCPGCGQKVAPDPAPNAAPTPNTAPPLNTAPEVPPVAPPQPAAPQFNAPPPQAPYGQPPPLGGGPAPQNGNALQKVPGLSALPPAMRLPALGVVVLLALALLGKMFGHSGTATPAQSGTPGGSGSSGLGGASATTAQAGVFQGRCTTEQGTPLANVDIKIKGVTSAGENTVTDVYTDSSGNYSQTLPPGTYSVLNALYPVTLGSTNYMLPLAMPDGTSNDNADIGPGIARDLVLHIHGKIAPTLPDAEWQSFYGGNLSCGFWGRYQIPGAPAGSITELTLVPVGPLADGTTGQTLVLRATNTLTSSGTFPAFLDIPIGQYTVTARLLNADGSLLEPLVISLTAATSDPNLYTPSLEGFTFSPSGFTSPYPAIGQAGGIGLVQVSLNDGSPGP